MTPTATAFLAVLFFLVGFPQSKCCAQSSCRNLFSGKWMTDDGNLTEMQLSENGCTLDGSFKGRPSGEHYEHQVHGTVRNDFWATVEIKRTGTGSHCQTTLFGSIEMIFFKQGSQTEIDTNKFKYIITGTSGDCGLRKTFTEERVWQRCPAAGCPKDDE